MFASATSFFVLKINVSSVELAVKYARLAKFTVVVLTVELVIPKLKSPSTNNDRPIFAPPLMYSVLFNMVSPSTYNCPNLMFPISAFDILVPETSIISNASEVALERFAPEATYA